MTTREEARAERSTGAWAGEIGDVRVLLTLSEGAAVHVDPSFSW